MTPMVGFSSACAPTAATTRPANVERHSVLREICTMVLLQRPFSNKSEARTLASVPSRSRLAPLARGG